MQKHVDKFLAIVGAPTLWGCHSTQLTARGPVGHPSGNPRFRRGHGSGPTCRGREPVSRTFPLEPAPLVGWFTRFAIRTYNQTEVTEEILYEGGVPLHALGPADDGRPAPLR